MNRFNLGLYYRRSGLYRRFQEVAMPNPNLTNMSVDALLELRAEVGAALSRRAKERRVSCPDLVARLAPEEKPEKAC